MGEKAGQGHAPPRLTPEEFEGHTVRTKRCSMPADFSRSTGSGERTSSRPQEAYQECTRVLLSPHLRHSSLSPSLIRASPEVGSAHAQGAHSQLTPSFCDSSGPLAAFLGRAGCRRRGHEEPDHRGQGITSPQGNHKGKALVPAQVLLRPGDGPAAGRSARDWGRGPALALGPP